MFDPNLNQSIQRWEYEGGRVLPPRMGNNLEGRERNKTFRSWNEINRSAPEHAYGSLKSSLIRPKPRVEQMA